MKYILYKYKAFGEWSKGKEVSKEVAEKKMQVRVRGYYYYEMGDKEDWYCPYRVEVVEG